MKYFAGLGVLVSLFVFAGSVKAQTPFTLNSAVWHAEVQGQPDVDRIGPMYEVRRNGVGELYGAAYYSGYSPYYEMNPSIRIVNSVWYATGWSGPPQSRSFLLQGTSEWTLDRTLTRPLIAGGGMMIGSFFGAGGSIEVTLAGAGGNVLFHGGGGFVTPGFVDALHPGTYTVRYTAAGSVTLSETMGHARTGGMEFEMWLAVPAPASTLGLGLVFIGCGGRRRRGWN